MRSSATLNNSLSSYTESSQPVSQSQSSVRKGSFHFETLNPQRGIMTAATLHENQKRAATSTSTLPTSKRMRNLAAPMRLQALAPIHQIEIAQRAAASLPAPYYVDEQAEAAKRVHAARAIDCWALTAEEEHEAEPSNEEKMRLRAYDKERLASTLIDLRKPRHHETGVSLAVYYVYNEM
ncbi:hypothetical protein RSOL_162800, partial [Rhizoctonia solani AG-3 Rhs1AP]